MLTQLQERSKEKGPDRLSRDDRGLNLPDWNIAD
jgi:hypothetical protein